MHEQFQMLLVSGAWVVFGWGACASGLSHDVFGSC